MGSTVLCHAEKPSPPADVVCPTCEPWHPAFRLELKLMPSGMVNEVIVGRVGCQDLTPAIPYHELRRATPKV